ncbi:RING-H2 finger protein ATL3-like [Senna tora]|uniref:RING-type E3 ubiquitin transferase n=1 Tax=Senna tora TaxID=362788 RepID=A0A834T481_9FABA|nr:RING-H2 finger protein ATL3-like [Senna tora]
MADSFNSTEPLNESPAVEVTGKIMVIAIVILFMVVVFVLVLHLYAKWFWWRIEEQPTPPPPRRRRRRRFVFAPGQDPSINIPHQSGLDPSLLKSLPVLTYQPQDFKEGLECAVCLSELVEGEKARLLPKCNHGFHVDCIDMWFQSHSTCPICRNPVAPESSKCNCSSSVRENASENSGQSEAAENLGSASASAMNVSESPNFPTNVLIWGNQTQVSSSGTSLEEEEGPSSSSTANTSGSSNSRHHEMLVIDIPSEANSSSLSPSGSRFGEDELKSPVTTRLRSLKRLLSRDKRLGPSSNPSSLDVEQAGRGQS